MSSISSHVLDTSEGKPAAGISIKIYSLEDESWIFIYESGTNENGRTENIDLIGKQNNSGIYKIIFETGQYFKSKNKNCFYPHVEIIFETMGDEHYHIPLLLSPFGYTTYRGS